MSSEPLLPREEAQPGKSERDVDASPSGGLPSGLRARLVTWGWITIPLVLGVILGMLRPSACGLPAPLDRVSAVLGWTYFTAWSLSFYPQLYLNFERKSVVGLSLDFQLLNLLGFVSYAVYNSVLYWNDAIREQYALHHGGNMPAVHANDVFFAIHATAITAVTLVQCCIYERGGQRPSTLSVAFKAAAVAGVLGYAALIAVSPQKFPGCNNCNPDSWLTWLNLLYMLSYIKLAVSLVKYLPQVFLNYQLQSTQGWNVWNVLLDFEGGVLSLAQQLLDSKVTNDWTPITGNPVKFGLGFTSMLFDFIFAVQHFVLYRDAPLAPKLADDGDEPDVEAAPLVQPVAQPALQDGR